MKGLSDFFSALKAAVQAEDPSVTFLFGAEFLGRRDDQPPRVVVVPHLLDGAMSVIGPHLSVHRLPGDLGVERRNVTIECWSEDKTAADDRAKQDDAAMCLRHLVWRHAQAIVRKEGHSAPGTQPGIYQVQVKAAVTPRERVQGAKTSMSFWIDFMIRGTQPTEANVPQLELKAEMTYAVPSVTIDLKDGSLSAGAQTPPDGPHWVLGLAPQGPFTPFTTSNAQDLKSQFGYGDALEAALFALNNEVDSTTFLRVDGTGKTDGSYGSIMWN